MKAQQQNTKMMCFYYPPFHISPVLYMLAFILQNVKNDYRETVCWYFILLSLIYDKDLLHPISPTKQPFVFPNREIYPVIFLRIIGQHGTAVGLWLTLYPVKSALKMDVLKTKTHSSLL
jgi:hypothetical protein